MTQTTISTTNWNLNFLINVKWPSYSSKMLSKLSAHKPQNSLPQLSTQPAVIFCVATETDTEHKKCLEEPLQNQEYFSPHTSTESL